jgi:uncharacterized membrane protein YfhO
METVILRANHFYRAVRLPGGKHQVEFRYEPRSFKMGAMISLATLSLMILISISVFIRQRKALPLRAVASVEILPQPQDQASV